MHTRPSLSRTLIYTIIAALVLPTTAGALSLVAVPSLTRTTTPSVTTYTGTTFRSQRGVPRHTPSYRVYQSGSCVDTQRYPYTPTASHCQQRLRPLRPFQQSIGRRDDRSVVLRPQGDTNIIGWENSSYARYPERYARTGFRYLSADDRRKKIQSQSAAGASIRFVNTQPGDRYIINQGYAIPRTPDSWYGDGDIRSVKAFWQEYNEERSRLAGRKVNILGLHNEDPTDYSAYFGPYNPTQGRYIPARRSVFVYSVN